MKYSLRLSLFFALALLIMLPLYAYAQEALPNPLRFNSVQEFVAGALRALVMVSLPILTFFIVFSGFKFISAQGNPNKLEEAKKNFVFVIMGALLILGAWLLATLIGNTVQDLTRTSSSYPVHPASEEWSA